MSRTRHLVIAGTGRAGTTFLVQYLAACGLDVGESEMAYYERARAGLERCLLGDRSAYVVKDPWFYETAPLLDLNEVAIDAVIVPVRDLRAAATSRIRNSIADLVDQGFPPDRGTMAHVAGGAIYPLDVETQMRTLALGQALLLQWCVEHSIEIRFLAYPRLATDHDYLYDQLAEFLPADLPRQDAASAFARVCRPRPAAGPGGTATADPQTPEALIWELELARSERDRAMARTSELERRLHVATDELAHLNTSLASSQQTVHELHARLARVGEADSDRRRLESDLATIRESEAYRVGMAVTWPARRAKRFVGHRFAGDRRATPPGGTGTVPAEAPAIAASATPTSPSDRGAEAQVAAGAAGGNRPTQRTSPAGEGLTTVPEP